MASVALYGCDDSGDNGGSASGDDVRGLGGDAPIIPGAGSGGNSGVPVVDMGMSSTGARLALVVRAVVNRRLESVSQVIAVAWKKVACKNRMGRDGLWRTRMCQDGQVSAWWCISPAEDCTPGETICLGNGNVAVCDNEQWVEQGSCSDGLACVEGECVSQACVNALQGRSYIGCDFSDTDLANSAFDSRDENFDAARRDD